MQRREASINDTAITETDAVTSGHAPKMSAAPATTFHFSNSNPLD
jgi:hypothetical protein